jgi:hypothetical protein
LGTVDSYADGQVAFLTQIATTGDAGLPNPSAKRALLIAIIQALDPSKMDEALNALAFIDTGGDELNLRIPHSDPVPVDCIVLDGSFRPEPFELEVD